MSNHFIQEKSEEFDKVVEFFKRDIAGLRTGRATPGLVENISVDAYGSRMPIIQLGSITVPEPRVIRIEPWDAGLVQAIEKGIREANLGFSGSVDGNIVRISLPQLSEENRRDLGKLLKERLEQAKVSLRNIRESIRDDIQTAEKNKEITEDDRFDFLKELDTETENWSKKVMEIAETKEKEIMTI
jgi:ribosome recycling factor